MEFAKFLKTPRGYSRKESKGMGAIFQEKGEEMLKKGKKFQNLGKK